MPRTLALSFIVPGTLALCSCLPMMAAGAAGSAIGSMRGAPQDNEHLRPEARSACSARAAQYGRVQIIDIVQRTPSKIVIWGTTGEGSERRSFECSYGTKITSFTRRGIKPAF